MPPSEIERWAATVAPMLARPADRPLGQLPAGRWAFDMKLDGMRALAFWDGRELLLRNRNSRDRAATYPELAAAAEVLGAAPIALDGEIVAATGRFQDVALRDKQTRPADVAAALATVRCIYIAFDILLLDGRDLRESPWRERRELLDTVGRDWRDPWQTSVVSDDAAFADAVRAAGGEGIIAKDVAAPYRSGRSGSWLKFKNIHRLTCLAVGYRPGNGARRDFGAMRLALLADDGSGTPVDVGNVGSGFSAADLRELRAALDAGASLPVEIACTGATRDGKLRHAVYVGRRTDVAASECTIAQLATLPRA